MYSAPSWWGRETFRLLWNCWMEFNKTFTLILSHYVIVLLLFCIFFWMTFGVLQCKRWTYSLWYLRDRGSFQLHLIFWQKLYIKFKVKGLLDSNQCLVKKTIKIHKWFNNNTVFDKKIYVFKVCQIMR